MIFTLSQLDILYTAARKGRDELTGMITPEEAITLDGVIQDLADEIHAQVKATIAQEKK